MATKASLFRDHKSLRAVIDACLEGKAGQIVSAGEDPKALRLDVGCYSIFGGDPDSKDTSALLKGVHPHQEFVYTGSKWKQRILAAFPDAVDRSMQTFIPGQDHLEKARQHSGDPGQGYQIVALTPEHGINEQLTPNGFQVHESRDAFYQNGFGFFVANKGQMIALVTTYTVSKDKAEIAISTDPQHRKKGLATSLAATMVMECSRRGLTPHWSAANPVSQRVARRVGFIENGICCVLSAPKL